MEIELGLKVSRSNNESTSTNLRITKDGTSPLFLSIETDSMFILIGNLKGYTKDKLKIDINEEGTHITISGEKVVLQVITVGWAMHKRETEVRKFRKVFRIPRGVILDGIKAKFNAEESVLRIFMPKSEKGVTGFGIEEVKEEDADRGKVPERQEIKQDVKVTGEVAGRPAQSDEVEPEEVKKDVPITKKERVTGSGIGEVKEEETDRGKVPERQEIKQDVKVTGKVAGRLAQADEFEPKEVRKAIPSTKKKPADKTMIHPGKDADLDEKNKALQEKSEGCEGSPGATELANVEEDQVTDKGRVKEDQVTGQDGGKEYTSAEKNGPVENHLSQQELDAEIRDGAEPKPETESLKPVHPEEVQGMGIEAETDLVKPPEEQVDNSKNSQAHSKKSKLCSPCFFAGSAILISIIVLVIKFVRPKRR